MDNPLLDTVTNNNIDTLIDSRTLQRRITELASEITRDYQNKELGHYPWGYQLLDGTTCFRI